ncbi:hypothetical protein [Borrelia hispanica]|uniref:hypothetical protein n=1 Tax=Borrelia hispanica TaxID=40835 RepID=UPI0004670D5D|nr:hypothetical protein [Borrelia hispanica]
MDQNNKRKELIKYNKYDFRDSRGYYYFKNKYFTKYKQEKYFDKVKGFLEDFENKIKNIMRNSYQYNEKFYQN